MTSPSHKDRESRIGHDLGDYADLIWRNAFPINEKHREPVAANNRPGRNHGN